MGELSNTEKGEMKSMLLFAASLAAFTGISQEETLSKMIKGFESGNVAMIESQLMTEVDFTLGEFEDFCSKPQVTAKLKEFFDSNNPNSFSIIHKGSSSSNEFFRIGELTTSSGSFRVTIFIEKDGSLYKVNQLKLE